jgi:succinate dehydrogenase / fumarate reductase, flavoprotein subunit
MSYSVTKRKFDVVIVGAGGSGMLASLQLARAGLKVAVLSKVFPTSPIPSRPRVASAPRWAI